MIVPAELMLLTRALRSDIHWACLIYLLENGPASYARLPWHVGAESVQDLHQVREALGDLREAAMIREISIDGQWYYQATMLGERIIKSLYNNLMFTRNKQ